MKTETQHTAGPYTISPVPGDNYIMAFSTSLGRKTSIALVLGWPGITDEEFKANKALLAQAPDLLAQRDGLLSELDKCVDYLHKLQLGARLTGLEREENITRCEYARAAIAKASGKDGGK